MFIFDENLIFVPNNSRKQAPFKLDECLMERVGSPLGDFFLILIFRSIFIFTNRFVKVYVISSEKGQFLTLFGQ